MDTKEQKIERLLTRNVTDVIEREHLRTALRSGKKLRVKLGIDPTSPDLHLGHAVVLAKLREFQDLGHTAILLIGNFTAQIGDPSGRDKTRPPLTEAEVKKNMQAYLKQAEKIIDIKKAEIVYNNDWLGKLNAKDTLSLLSKVSLQQVIEREDFDKRLSEQRSVQMHELIYPILVAYDSVAVKADVEMGGADQLFNFMMGRAVMERFEMKPQDILTTPLLVGTDGQRKMSKSLGNYIGLSDAPNDMFGKVMSIPDGLMPAYFLMCTDREMPSHANAANPRETKLELAALIVERYHGAAAAKKARENFEKIFSRHEAPDDLPVLKLKKAAKGNLRSVAKSSKFTALDIVLSAGGFKSNSEARRLIEQGGFEFDGKVIRDPVGEIAVQGGEVVRVGKKRYFKAG